MTIGDLFYKTDLFLLGKVYGPVSRLLGRKFGVTNGQSTRFCAGIVLVMSFIEGATQVSTVNPKGTVFVLVSALVFGPILAGIVYLYSLKADDKNQANYFRLFFVRCFWFWFSFLLLGLVFFPSDLYHVILPGNIWQIEFWGAHKIGDLAMVSGVYFASLPPAPPKEQKEPRSAFAWDHA